MTPTGKAACGRIGERRTVDEYCTDYGSALLTAGVAQFLFVVARRLAVTGFPFLQGGRDDLGARIDRATKDQRPEAATVVGEIMPLLLVETGSEQIDCELQLLDQFALGGMAGLVAHDAVRIQVFFIETIQLRDENVDRVRHDKGAVLDGQRLRARAPERAGAKIEAGTNLDVRPVAFPGQVGFFNPRRQFVVIGKQVHITT